MWSRSRWSRLAATLMVGAAAAAPGGLALADSATQILTAACGDDARRFCSGVTPGGGRIIACLKQNKDSLSDQCRRAAAAVAGMSGGNLPNRASVPPATATAAPAASGDAADALVAAPATAAAAVPPSTPVTDAAPPAAPAAAKSAHRTAAADGSYLVMKKVQVSGPGPDAAHSTMPAFDLLIPPDWKIQGGIAFGRSPDGCYADIFAINVAASSPDETTVFAAAPDTSWQYADDPSVQKSLNDPTRRALGVGGKPCPVGKPMTAEDYIRRNVLKAYPAGTTVVSVAPFPELDGLLRKRQGLAPGNDRGGSTRTDAVRVRLAYSKDDKDVEAWLAVGVVLNIYPAGRGSFYDSHATSLVSFEAPKGQLDRNDRLFQVMMSSLQPEPAWVSYSGGVLAKLYQAQAQKSAIIDQAWAQFYTHAAQTINGVTANAIRGADASAFRADQNIRGVQTFRDPSTGRTQELSNLYDHAWQNGSNEYVMSNDPSFNPNEHLSGSWNQLQAVNP